ncbi:MAG: hypothetical protein, partial [Olavius algarvensis Gamma 1 endosymbiont]
WAGASPPAEQGTLAPGTPICPAPGKRACRAHVLYASPRS